MKTIDRNAIIKKIQSLLGTDKYLANPLFPDFSFQPDLIVNRDGNLTVIQVDYLRPNDNVDWKTLQLIEQVFEVKLFLGNKATISLILPDASLWKNYCIELLTTFFDNVSFDPQALKTADLAPSSKTEHFQLWDRERKFQNFRSQSLKDLNILKFTFNSELNEKEIFQHVIFRFNDLNVQYSPKPSVLNLKNYYISEKLNLQFSFDFLIYPSTIIEIKALKRLSKEVIQNLLVKARLIRYKLVEGKIVPNQPNYRMILILNGLISGPVYDQMRILRLLMLAGWDLYPASVMNKNEEMSRVLLNGGKSF